MGGIRQLLRLGGLVLSVFAVCAVVAAPALAEYRHPTAAAEFGPDGTGATRFDFVNALAYEQAGDRLFVLDVGGSVHGFDHPAPGAFAPLGGNFPIALPELSVFSDLAVDNSPGGTAGDIYLASAYPTIDSYDGDGNPLSTIYDGGGEACGVAVDGNGHIWGGNGQASSVVEFVPGVATIARSLDVLDSAALPCKVAVDGSTDDLYVSSSGGLGVWQYTAASGYAAAKEIVADGYDERLVINSAKHVLYAGGPNSGGMVRGYSTITGALVETNEMPGSEIMGLAVDEASDTLFVAMGDYEATGDGNRVLEMPGLITPKATTDPSGGTAVVSGTADPDGAGAITQCYFEFGPSTAYGSKQNCTQSLPINSATAVTATLPGLLREQTYHYRLVVGTATPGAVAKGASRTIRMVNVKGLATEAASQVKRSSARLNASFEGTDEATSYYFEYGSNDYESRLPIAPGEELVPPGVGPTAISMPISGLSGGTRYFARVVAKNSKGVSYGNGIAFTTPPAVDSVLTEPATVTSTTATLHGSYDGATNDTPPGPLESFRYYFEWGKTESYGNTTATPPGIDAGAHAETVHVSASITRLPSLLEGSTSYHYRLVVSNSAGTNYGPDRTFTTLPYEPPVVNNARVEAVLPTRATLAAEVDTDGAAAEYVIQYGKSAKYAETTPARPISAGSVTSHVSAPLEQLTPGTLYHYRVRVTSPAGTASSPDQTFATPGVPAFESSEASAGTTSARLSATVIPNASPTAIRFEYGTGDSYGAVTAPVEAGSGLDKVIVSTEVGGLQPDTTYHYRVLAANGIGVTSGPGQTFTTQRLAPTLVPIAGEVGKVGQSRPCKRGFGKLRGKCVKKHKKHGKHRKHKHGKRPGHGRR